MILIQSQSQSQSQNHRAPMDSFEDDLKSIFSDVAGTEAKIITDDGEISIRGQFDKTQGEISVGEGYEASSEGGVFVCASSDVIGLEYGATLLINGRSYQVVNILSDDAGMTEIELGDRLVGRLGKNT